MAYKMAMKQCLNVKYQYRYNVKKNITAKYSYLTVEKKKPSTDYYSY